MSDARSDVQVRVLRAGEEHVLRQVATDVFDKPIDPPAAGAYLADGRSHMAVALDRGVVVAFASGIHYLHPDKPTPELFVNEVAVAPTHRRRGLGRALLEALLTHAGGLGCRSAWVLTEPDNEAAVALYAALGGRRERPDPVLFELPVPGEDEDR